MDYLAGNVQLVIAIFDLIIYKKFAIHLTEKEKRGLCSFLYTLIMKMSH